MRYAIYTLILFFLLSCSANDPKRVFEDRTGLTLNEPGSQFVVTDTYELTEGEFSIVFKTSDTQIKSWLKGNPPWNNRSWHRGKIPVNIGLACQFNFPDRVWGAGPDDSDMAYYGDKSLVKLLSDTTNYYSYVEDCCPGKKGLRFHDGRLLIIQPRTKMIYYSVWDF